MKNKDFILLETSLQNALDDLQESYELCDTSLKDTEWESNHDINDWNKRYNEVMQTIAVLKMEMIFTFKIEESEE